MHGESAEMRARRLLTGLAFSLIITGTALQAADWPRFRGPNGSGVTADKAPVEWGTSQHISWKLALPGRGVSCPIVVGQNVFVTCYSGYGIPGAEGNLENLKRHLLCIDRSNGTVRWTATVPAELPEDPFSGAGVPAHGYASHTPTSDGERVYVFFGKTGVLAFDLEGNELWRQSVGKASGRMRWGSAASPVLLGDLLIVNASDEAEALVAFDKRTGELKWRAEAAGLGGSWSTPVVATAEGAEELVLAVPHEVWGFNPSTGKLKWYAAGTNDDTMSASAVFHESRIFVMGGRGGNSVALQPGGKGEVTPVWTNQASGRFGSPVIFGGHFYLNNGAVLACHDLETGERVKQVRLGDGVGPAATPERPTGGPGGRGAGGGGRGGGDYASPIIANGKLYITLRNGFTHVLEATPELTPLAVNDLSADRSGFDATPAVSEGQLFLRSHSTLYCIAE
jgi:outer membrane protein assembly factor BamB